MYFFFAVVLVSMRRFIFYPFEKCHTIFCVLYDISFWLSLLYTKSVILFSSCWFFVLEANESRSKHTATKYENMKLWWKESWCFNDYGDGEYFFFLTFIIKRTHTWLPLINCFAVVQIQEKNALHIFFLFCSFLHKAEKVQIFWVLFIETLNCK